MVSNRVIQFAVEEYEKEWVVSLPSEEELSRRYEFTEGFTKRMEALMRKEKRPFYHMFNTVAKRVAVVLVTLVVAAATLCMSVEAIRMQIVQFFVETFEKYSEVTPALETQEQGKERIETAYGLAGVPEGYELQENSAGEIIVLQSYTKDGNQILFRQHPGLGSLGTNTEGAEVNEAVEVSGQQGQYVEMDQNRSVIWVKEGYCFKLSATELSKEELLELAEGIEPQEE